MRNGDGGSGNDLPGFEGVHGRKVDETLRHTEPKPRLIPVNRNQMRIVPVDVERLIGEEHEARAIWSFVGRLDLASYYQEIGSVEGEGGRPAYDPQVLMSVWIYGYSKGIGSAREIARRTEYDPAFQWIAAMEIINYHTLSDFRISHKESLDRVFIEVLGVLSAEGLIALERTTQDGTKVKACAGTGSFRKEATIMAHLKAAREQVRLLQESEEEASLREQKAHIRAAHERKERLDRAFEELKKVQRAGARASMTDPDARNMKQSDGGYAPSYNLQISADSAHDIIIAQKISQHPEDFKELLPAVERIEDNTGKKPRQMIADGGYTTRENIIAMAEREVEFIGSLDGRTPSHPGQFASRGIDDAFRPDRFTYDAELAVYLCPQGKVLRHRSTQKRAGKVRSIFSARARDCQACSSNGKCCPQGKRRSIVRTLEHAAINEFAKKMKTEEAKEIYKTRAPIAEFPHAWIKEKIGLRQFHVRGLLKVGMEALWACLTYNIQQWIRLCWRPRLAAG
jgi:transposase